MESKENYALLSLLPETAGDIVRAVCADRSLYMVKDSGGGYAWLCLSGVRSSVVVNGKWGTRR